MNKMAWTKAIELLDDEKFTTWACEKQRLMARAASGRGAIQFHDSMTEFGTWDGEEGTDGALLTLVPSGDVYDESANLISKAGK